MGEPKGRFFSRLPNGDFLNLTIWPGKKEPDAEVIVAEIRHYRSDSNWETVSEHREVACGIPQAIFSVRFHNRSRGAVSLCSNS